jgi:hypothetical protein
MTFPLQVSDHVELIAVDEQMVGCCHQLDAESVILP